jgi:hypothetical protein
MMKDIIEAFSGIFTAFETAFTEISAGDWFALVILPFNVVIALFHLVLAICSLAWYWVYFLLLAVLAMPAMFVMAKWYPTWESWIKDNKNLTNHIDRMLLILPFSVLIFWAMIFYGLFHKRFEEQIKARYGLKLF